VFAPPDCALTYRYYSLHVEGGDAGVLAAADATAKRFADATTGLPAAMQGSDNGYFVIPTFTAATRVAVKRSLDPAVTALNLFGIAAAASTLLVALLIAVRLARRDEDDAQVWFLLGATRAQRRAAIAFRLVVACAGGLVGALLVGWVGSAIGPVASARSVEPAGRMGLSGDIGLVVLGAAAVFMVGASTIAAIGPTKARHRTLRTSVSSTGWSLPNLGSPWLTAGARAAFAGSGARALLAASVAAVVAVVATVVFTTSLNTFVAKPDRFGWPYDVAAMVGFGYGGSDEAAIAATLDRPEVKAWGMAIVDSGSAINGEPTPIVAERDGFGELALPVIDGTAPIGDDELGLGALTADRLGLAPGDKALLVTTFGEREVTVSGLVVLPTIGQYEADRASLGNGALLSERLRVRA